MNKEEEQLDSLCILYRPWDTDKVFLIAQYACLAYHELKPVWAAGIKKMVEEDPGHICKGVFIVGYDFEKHIRDQDFSEGHIWVHDHLPQKLYDFVRSIMPPHFFDPKQRKALKAQMCMSVNAA